MTRPGVNITTRESAPVTTIPTDVGTGFMVGITESGPTTVTAQDVVHSMSEYEAKWAYTKRNYVNAITAYDSAETFFKEGGYALYVGRVVGPAAAVATVNVPDSLAATTLVANAKGPGDYGNDLNVVIRTNAQDSTIPVNYFRVRVQTDAAVILEESYDLIDDQAAILWSNTVSQYITFVDNAGSANDPAAGTYSLTGGLLDFASIVDANWQSGLDRLTADLGPGLVFGPGRTTSAGQVQLANHALAKNRVAICDGPDTATVATITAQPAAVIDTSTKRSRFTGIFVPWLRIPGLTSGSQRLIPPSAAVAGLFARNMGLGYSPNEPAAGARGVFNTVLSVSQTFDSSSRQTINSAGVNLIRDIYGTRKVYGWRTTADPSSDAKWIALSNSILHRAVAALANAVGERFIFRQIDGERKMINEFGAALIGEACMPFFAAGSLYGTTPDDAFKVDVGPSVNTNTTIANNELHAVISLRMSPFGEEVDIELVKYLVSEQIPA
jgi:phage tail sheath protein FI